jgi:hypothetical protein
VVVLELSGVMYHFEVLQAAAALEALYLSRLVLDLALMLAEQYRSQLALRLGV